MATLYDLADVFRSKNAGPFLITIDIMLPNRASFARVLASAAFTSETIAAAYDVDRGAVRVIPFEEINTIKVTLPRVMGERGSGSPGDTDVYGAQHHGPLLGIQIE
jgi:hypothetical protein